MTLKEETQPPNQPTKRFSPDTSLGMASPAPTLSPSSSRRSASAKKGWIKRREKAQAQAHLEEQAMFTLAHEQAQPQQTVTKAPQMVTNQTQTRMQTRAQKLSQAIGQSTIQITRSPEHKSRQQKRKHPPVSESTEVDDACSGTGVADSAPKPFLLLIRAIAEGNDAAVTAALERTTLKKETEQGDLDINTVDQHGTSALIQAVKSRNRNVVKHLLDMPHVDVNHEDHIRRSAVVWAVYSADIDMMLLLLHQREDMNVDRALIVAASCGYEDMVNLLLTEGRNVIDVNARDHLGNTALLCAIRNNREGTDIDVIVDMLMQNPELDVSLVNAYGDSALIHAVRAKNYYVVEALLSHPSSASNDGVGVDIIEHEDIHGVCAFTWALHCNCLDIAHLVAEEQADRRRVTPKPAAAADHTASPPDVAMYGKTALTTGIVRLLWMRYEEHKNATGKESQRESDDNRNDTEDVNGQSHSQVTTINAGVSSWNFLHCERIFNKYIITHLLMRGDLSVNKVDSKGFSALTWAMEYKYERVVQILLSRPDVMINRLNTEGQTPLIFACRYGYQEFVELLLQRGDLILNAPDSQGKTALDWAVENNYIEIVACLAGRSEFDHETWCVKAIRDSDDEMLSLLLTNMPPDIKHANAFLDRMLKFSLSVGTVSDESSGNNNNTCTTTTTTTGIENKIVNILQAECQQQTAAVSDAEENYASPSSTTAAIASKPQDMQGDPVIPRVILCVTVLAFVMLNYGLNAAYERYFMLAQ